MANKSKTYNIKNAPKLVKLAPWIYNRNTFYFRDHPEYHPDTQQYLDYWESHEIKAIEGYWGLDQELKRNPKTNKILPNREDSQYDPSKPGGFRFMTPQHYWYVNFCFIQHLPDENSSPITIMPDCRDIDWYWFYDFIICMGFCGFELDEEVSCHSLLKRYHDSLKPNSTREFELTPREKITWGKVKHLLKKPDGSFKDYRDPMEYLKSTFDKPMGRILYYNTMLNNADLEARGGGKEQPLTSKILTEHGWKQMGSLKIGDKIYGKNGKLTNVVDIFPQGVKDVYELELADGRKIECGLEHLWILKYFNEDKVMSTKDIISKGLYNIHSKNGGKSWKFKIPNIECIEYKESYQSIDSYLLGCLLGDGTMSTNTPKIASDDNFIINEFKRLLGKDFKVDRDNSTTNNYTIVYTGSELLEDKRGVLNKHNPLRTCIKSLNLSTTCKNKFIPEQYKIASKKQRLHLIQGLLDTDGSISKDGSIEFTNTSEKLVDDLADVIRSLGIKCYKSFDKREGQNHDIKGHECKRTKYWRLYINTDQEVFRLPRKKNRIKKKTTTRHLYTAIVNITKKKAVEQQCILVDNEDHSYITDGYTVTHNTYRAIGCLSQAFNFFGARTFEEYLKVKKGPDLCVGSALSSKSGSLLQKFLFSQNELVDNFGNYEDKENEIFIPGFFYKKTSGVISVGNEKNPFRHAYKENINGIWKTRGTNSAIIHNSYADNPEAFVGKRSILMIEDEFGLNPKARACAHADNTVMKMSGVKMGIALKTGTGGNVSKIQEAKDIFYNPDSYGYLRHEDHWEGRVNGIGLFIPSYYVDSSFRDENGNQDIEKAYEQEMYNRQKLASGNSTKMLDGYIIDHPLVPSEMFLSPEMNIFPTTLIREHRADLEVKKVFENITSTGFLEYTDTTKNAVVWRNQTDKYHKPIIDFDLKKYDGYLESKIVIYEHPTDNIPDPKFGKSLYKISYDPVKDDHGGTSLAAIQVYKGSTIGEWNKGLKNTIVATYYGRYDRVEDIHEIAIKLALYYNAKILPEIDVPDFVRHCKRNNKQHLLQISPFEAFSSLGVTQRNKYQFGVKISKAVNLQGEQLIRNWLLEEIGYDEETDKKILNLHNLYDMRLLDELINYSRDNNTDGVSAFQLLMFWIHQENLVPMKAQDKAQHKSKIDRYFDKYIKKNNTQKRPHTLKNQYFNW